jgi:DNA sulfur modification protein DndB
MIMEKLRAKVWEGIVPEAQIKKHGNIRKSPYLIESVEHEQVQRYVDEGWEIDKEFKTKVRVRKLKPVDISFEDEVWSTMSDIGFSYLNKDRKFRIPYSDDLNLTQQIDVFAADEETILIIECKATGGDDSPKKTNFKEAIEALGGKRDGILKTLRKLFPAQKQKVKFIFATKNYYLSEPDKQRLDNFSILHLDEEAIKYYQDLSKHLGISARFQLLGYLFDGQKIPALDNQVVAIRGDMGGHTYYSFSIEPEKLLKLGYILHRNKANRKLMPTYQRLIKKPRLLAIHNFVNTGGFFPNSIVININTNGREPRFDLAAPQVESSSSRIGTLYLPQTYRSVFIIDGQHRLYGYADSDYKCTNCIPVVAFTDLDRNEQLKLFMQINENQKAVPKNLRNTLNSDLLWNSDNKSDQIKALKLQLAMDLGEEPSSALFDRVQVGENPKTAKRCITIDTIKIGLDRSNFFGSFSKNAIKIDGTFYRGNNDETYKILYPFLEGCFNYIKEQLPDEWHIGEASNGFISINAGIESLIRVFSDIVDHLIKNNKCQPKSDKTEKPLQEAFYYIDPLIIYFKNISADEKQELRRSYGVGLRTKYWRKLEKVISEARTDFNPDGMKEYWKNESKRFNTQSFEMVRDIETFMKEDFLDRLQKFYGNNWFKKGIPPKLQDDATLAALAKNREKEDAGDEKTPWDCLTIIDYRKIAVYGSNWRDVFEAYYTQPNREKKGGNKEDKTNWMQKLERIRNQNFHEYSVKEEEYVFLCDLHDWLIKKKVEPNDE